MTMRKPPESQTAEHEPGLLDVDPRADALAENFMTHTQPPYKSKLIESRTVKTLPSGTTITTLHLTPEAKRGLSTNGARILALAGNESVELTTYDYQQRFRVAYALTLAGAGSAAGLASAGVSAVFCAMLPATVFSVVVVLWGLRDLRTLKRRQLARQTDVPQTEMFK